MTICEHINAINASEAPKGRRGVGRVGMFANTPLDMSCTSPRCAFVPAKGGRPVFLDTDLPCGSFQHPSIGMGRIVYIPCGHCLDCLIARRQDLTMLQSLEASLHSDNWFLTLTYDDLRLGYTPLSLDKRHVSVFLEDMRHWCTNRGFPFRYYGCGEYGDDYGRPHYHLSVFGFPADKLGLIDDSVDKADFESRFKGLSRGSLVRLRPPMVDSRGNPYWFSPVISQYWPYGNHMIYRACRETFQYVAQYVTKKLFGNEKRDFVRSGRVLPYSFQCRPSVGYPWFVRYFDDVSVLDDATGRLVNDFVSVDGRTWRCPRIFSKWMSRDANFGGQDRCDEISAARAASCPPVPDRLDLLRRSRFAKYRASHCKQENKHKEIK